MILEVKNLSVSVKEGKEMRPIVKNVSFGVNTKSCLGILGESGSGKSMTCKALMGVLEENFHIKGESNFKGKNILTCSAKEKQAIHGKSMCMILQNPMTAFNPLFTVESQVVETLRTHLPLNKKEALRCIEEAFLKMNLQNTKEILKKYPHELSGGMLQRIMIAMTLALEPDLLIADEPTTAIDSLNQLEVIKEFKRLREVSNMAMIFITHDLSVMAQLADEIIVMEKGHIVEQGKTREIIGNPKKDYTKYLIGTRMKLLHKFSAIARKAEEYDAEEEKVC